jgi:hypothetical protein
LLINELQEKPPLRSVTREDLWLFEPLGINRPIPDNKHAIGLQRHSHGHANEGLLLLIAARCIKENVLLVYEVPA